MMKRTITSPTVTSSGLTIAFREFAKGFFYRMLIEEPEVFAAAPGESRNPRFNGLSIIEDAITLGSAPRLYRVSIFGT